MLGWARTSKRTKDEEKLSTGNRSLNVNEEYLHAFRTQSYVDFFTKAQQLVKEPTATYPQLSSLNPIQFNLLEPEQKLIPSILESLIPNSSLLHLKPLMLRFFETSAQASEICSKLLTRINETHDNYEIIQRALLRNDSAISELGSFCFLENPFSDPNLDDFKAICENFSSILSCLKLKRKKVARRVKLVEFIKKASGISLTVGFSLVALVAIGIALHSISGIVMGSALVGFSPMKVKKWFLNLNNLKSRSLRKLRERLDVAAKGIYILNRDFDTVSRIVARLHDEVEHKKEMIRFCLERKEDKFPLQEVVKELRKNGVEFKRQIEELEEHVCLCLVTINRARVSLIKELSEP